MESGSRLLHADHALTPSGWQRGVTVRIGEDGRIASVVAAQAPEDGAQPVGILVPAPGNLHSHTFQRAMAGLTERRGPDPRDTFWTWRVQMYRFLDVLTPEQVGAIAAQSFVEMLEAGYASVAEFHYLHHRPGGGAYDTLAELSGRIAGAASETGIGLTLLPVLYSRGGVDGRALAGGQLRFGSGLDRFAALVEGAERMVAAAGPDARLGLAAHSLRAVRPEDLGTLAALRPRDPLHLHIAEQTGEVEAIRASYGAPPVRWLMDHCDIDPRWCLIHATHMTPEETGALAASGAVAGLCPVTEANLGDGIFAGLRYVAEAGRWGIGTDSNIRIGLTEELRSLEYSQRLAHRGRAMLAAQDRSTGRTLFDAMAAGGAQALGRAGGAITPGHWADLVALDPEDLDLAGLRGDAILDAWIFAAGDRAVRDVWSAGRHMVRRGRHVDRDRIAENYRRAIQALRAAL